jgi:hypothetical protein
VSEEVAACQQGLGGSASVDVGRGRTLPLDQHPCVPQDVQGGSNMTGTDCGLFTHK